MVAKILFLCTAPRLYRSEAKVHHLSFPVPDLPWYGPKEGEIESAAELLQTTELALRAEKRVKALHPETHTSPVRVTAARVGKSSIIHVLADGTDARSTRLHLDALVNDFVSFLNGLRENSARLIVGSVSEWVKEREKAVEASLDELESCRRAVESISARVDMERLPGRLKQLRDAQDDKRAQKLPDEAHVTEIRRIEAQLESYEDAASKLRLAQDRHTDARALHQRLVVPNEALERKWNELMHASTVAVLGPSTEAVPLPKITWENMGFAYAIGGCLAGLLIGLWRLKRTPGRPGSAPC
jgi:hypothetical protein